MEKEGQALTTACSVAEFGFGGSALSSRPTIPSNTRKIAESWQSGGPGIGRDFRLDGNPRK